MVQRRYDARHEWVTSWSFYVRDSLSTRKTTLIPIIMNDDAQGDPDARKVHPEHASWTELAYPNCFPDSEVRNMKVVVDIIITKGVAILTGLIRCRYALISCAFPEDLDALDEKSGLTFKEIFELQKEATDRQTYPLWNGVKLVNGSTMHVSMPGLTTNQNVEAIAWSYETVTDQLRYGRLKGLMKKCMPIGYRTTNIRPKTIGGAVKRLTFNFVPSNSKFINPYTFLGLLIDFPQAVTPSTIDVTKDQPVNEVNFTEDSHIINVGMHVQYSERNPDFDMSKV